MRQFPDRPWVAVGAIVIKNDHILMIRRAKEPNKGMLSLPGGAQDLGETVIEAAIRETFEETKVHSNNGFVVNVIDSIHLFNEKIEYHYTIVEICLNWVSGDPVANDDVTQAQWYSLSELESEKLPPKTMEVIKKAFDYRSRNASFTDE